LYVSNLIGTRHIAISSPIDVTLGTNNALREITAPIINAINEKDIQINSFN